MGKWLGWLITLTMSSVAVAGPGGSGGGDPQVIEFLMLADQVAGWLKTSHLLPNVDADAFQAQAIRLRRSLDAPYAVPFLIFSDDPVKCNIGGRKISKVACTVDGEVTVYRNVWMHSTVAQKFELLSQEIFLLMGIETNRYSMAQVIGEHADQIGAKPIETNGGPIVITSVTGASAVSTLGQAHVTIWAGMSGPSCGNGSDTCNSCEQCKGMLCACNTHRINDNTRITISFISDSTDITKNIVITNSSGVPSIIGDRYLGPGMTNTITTTWGQLCAAAGSGSCEESSINANLNIGLSDGVTMFSYTVMRVVVLNPNVATIDDCSGNAGSGAICNFKVEAGNGRAFLTDLQGDAGFPGMTTGIRVFVSDKDFAHTSPNQATRTVDMPITPDGAVQNGVVDDLTNGVMYYFRLAAVDQAGNMYAFISDTNIQDSSYGNCRFPSDPAFPDICRYHTIPAKE